MKVVSIINHTIITISCFCLFFCSRISKTNNYSKVTNPYDIHRKKYNLILSDTSNYDKYNFDFDNDGYVDKIFCSKQLFGDSLYIFKNNGIHYELSLKTINFSEDGLFTIKNIEKSKEINSIIKIDTYFNGSGGMLQEIYLNYNSASRLWKINNTIFRTTFCDENNNCFKKICNIKQNIDLNEKTNWIKYRNINEANRNECIVEKLIK